MLQDNDAGFKTTVPGDETRLTCRVMEQKELSDGLSDEECGRPVQKGHAGLCQYVLPTIHC